MFLRDVKPICRSRGALFLNSIVNGYPRPYIATLIDSFRCHHNVSCSGGHEPDSLIMTTGKGYSSCLPLSKFPWPCPFCFVRERVIDCIWSSYWCITVIRALLCAIPRYRHDTNSLTMERLEGLPLSGPPHVVAHGLGTASICTHTRTAGEALLVRR